MKILGVILAVIVLTLTATSQKLDPRLSGIHALFIKGNNQAGEGARKELEKDEMKHKGCLTLATNPKDSDATLEIAAESSSAGGSLGVRDWIASGSLTTTKGDVLWQESARFSDAPSRVAARRLVSCFIFDCGMQRAENEYHGQPK